jgi:nucleotide-binding universal stress UspA family protein
MHGPFEHVMVAVGFEDRPDEDDDALVRIETDGTQPIAVGPTTLAALRTGARLAARGELRLVHATPDMTHLQLYGPYGSWFPVDADAQIRQIAKSRAEAVLRQLAAQYCPGVAITTEVVSGPAHRVIVSAARRHPTDVIVLPISGHGAMQRALLGSTAGKVVRHAPCPVLVIPHVDRREAPTDAPRAEPF